MNIDQDPTYPCASSHPTKVIMYCIPIRRTHLSIEACPDCPHSRWGAHWRQCGPILPRANSNAHSRPVFTIDFICLHAPLWHILNKKNKNKPPGQSIIFFTSGRKLPQPYNYQTIVRDTPRRTEKNLRKVPSELFNLTQIAIVDKKNETLENFPDFFLAPTKPYLTVGRDSGTLNPIFSKEATRKPYTS